MTAFENRYFLVRAVTWAAGQGLAQFVDLGAGTPLHKSSTRVLEDIHLTAQAANPSVRVAYIDNDRIFVARSKAFRATAKGVAVAEADLTDPASVLAHPGVRAVIDPAEPVCLVFGLVLSLMPARQAREVVAGMPWCASGGARRPGSPAMAAGVLCQADDMRKYVIMGIQGSGKGTQAKMLAADLDLVHISVGDIFRWNVQNHTKLGAQVRRTMAAGELVGDDLVESVVRDRLTQHDWNFGFIIDGFPRDPRQAEFFLESYDIDGVIELDLPDSEVRRRVLNRRLCGDCGMDYNLIANSPKVPGRCDMCGGELITREDDTEEALAVRLRDYHDQTNPVLEIFRRKEYVYTVDARPAPDVIQQQIRTCIGVPPYKG